MLENNSLRLHSLYLGGARKVKTDHYWRHIVRLASESTQDRVGVFG
jgi:hypothetical protein